MMAKCRICGAGAEEYSTLCRDCGQNPEELADIIDSRDAEVAALKAELYNALTTVLCHCSCDGDYDCDRCEANLKRRSQLKQD